KREADATRAYARDFFANDGAEAEVAADPAIFFRDRAAEEAAFAGLAPHLAADLSVFFPLGVEGGDPLLDKAAGRGAEEFMFFVVDFAFHGHPVFFNSCSE